MKYLIPVFFIIFSQPLQANEAQLLELLKTIQASPQKTESAIKAGDSRALLCKYCHGKDGNSLKPSIPNLAGQNTSYLIRQFEVFATGKRSNKTMNEIAKLLTPEDKVNIALFYARQKIKPQKPYKPELLQTGKRLFETKCFFCHGRDGHGKADMPRIASQPGEYITRTLSSYNSALVKRAETQMSAIARTLQKDEIQALASYLTTLE